MRVYNQFLRVNSFFFLLLFFKSFVCFFLFFFWLFEDCFNIINRYWPGFVNLPFSANVEGSASFQTAWNLCNGEKAGRLKGHSNKTTLVFHYRNTFFPKFCFTFFWLEHMQFTPILFLWVKICYQNLFLQVQIYFPTMLLHHLCISSTGPMSHKISRVKLELDSP